jgi:hypothetical protein
MGLVSAALVCLLSSCTAKPLFLFFLDTYTAQLQPGLVGDGRPLARELEPNFRTATAVRSPGREAEKELRSLLVGRRPSAVYLGPLFSLDANRLAGDFPGVTFVRPSGAGDGQGPSVPNWIRLQADYGPAMQEAGGLAARLAVEPAFLERIGGGPGGTAAVGVGILVSESTPWLQDRVAAFRDGFLAAGAVGEPVYRQVDSPNDRVRARQVLEEMRQEGASIFLLLTYSLTGFCLEYLQKESAVAIVQDATAAAAYPSAVVLYLEEDMAGALQELRDLPWGRPGRPRVVAVPVRLRVGPAAAGLPAALTAGINGP